MSCNLITCRNYILLKHYISFWTFDVFLYVFNEYYFCFNGSPYYLYTSSCYNYKSVWPYYIVIVLFCIWNFKRFEKVMLKKIMSALLVSILDVVIYFKILVLFWHIGKLYWSVSYWSVSFWKYEYNVFLNGIQLLLLPLEP